MAFIAVATVGAAGLGLAGGMMSADASKDAAAMQAAAADRATQLQREIYNQNREDQEPWRKAGAEALSGLGNSDFQRDFTTRDFDVDPGYNFRMAEGQKAIERSAAARGGLNSGANMKALAKYGQGLASEEYGNAYNRFNSDRDRRFNRLSSVAGIGQTANSANAQSGQNFANQAGSNMMGAANAQGAASIASSNAWGNALSGIGNNAMNGLWMSRQKTT